MPSTAPARESPSAGAGRPARRLPLSLLALGASLALLVLMAVHISQGTATVGPHTLWRAFGTLGACHDGSGQADAVLVASRLPRLAAGLVVGCTLGAAGAALQSVSRNVLASPDTLAVNAGAYLAVVAVAAFGITLPPLPAGGTALIGGLLAAGIVLGLARAGTGPTRLVLAGSALTLGLSGLSEMLLLPRAQQTTGLYAWGNGSLARSRRGSRSRRRHHPDRRPARELLADRWIGTGRGRSRSRAGLRARGTAGTGAEPTGVIGIGVSAGAAALVSLLIVLTDPHNGTKALTWLAGSTYGRSFPEVLPVLGALAVSLPILAGKRRELDLIGLDADAPRLLGIRLGTTRLGLLVIAVVLTAAAVAAVGVIGFVGLMAPHAARASVGPRHGRVLPVAALLGSLLVVVADTVGRTVIAPAQIPVGVVTAVIGAPYFGWLLWRAKVRD